MAQEIDPAKEQQKIESERAKNAQPGFFLKAAIWILSRVPFTKHRYQNWTSGRRIMIGWLLWLVCLPIIPIAIIIFWYSKDPEGFKKSQWAKALIVLALAWTGMFGLVATEPAQLDVNGKYSPIQTQADGEKTVISSSEKPDTIVTDKEAKTKIENKKQSEPTSGRKFDNCTEAFKSGVFDIRRSDPSYENRLDRDNDGIACER